MHRFTNILFSPLGDTRNPAAMRRVADLASRNDASVTMLGVIGEPSRFQRLVHREEFVESIQDAQREAVAKKLARWAPPNTDVPVETTVVSGSAALAIIEQVLVAKHDLVVVTTDDDAADHATIKRLLRKCPCPVWVIRPSRARVQRVLAAVNPDPSEEALNREVLDIASSMVAFHGGELHVVHAWELYGESTMRSSAFMHTPESELEELLRAEQASRAAALDELLAGEGFADQPWRIHLHKGPAAEIICAAVEVHRINLLVMGTVARTGVAGLVMGNTAESVLDRVGCSVIATKPPGFVSPLELVVR